MEPIILQEHLLEAYSQKMQCCVYCTQFSPTFLGDSSNSYLGVEMRKLRNRVSTSVQTATVSMGDS